MSLHRIDPDDLKEALAACARMRDEDDDPHRVAKWLLYFHRRCHGLEELLHLVDRYLRFGMPEHELGELRVLVERLRESESASGDSVSVDDTLPL